MVENSRKRVISLIPSGRASLPVPASAPAHGLQIPKFPADQLGRPLRDLRISVTDRCNFRCKYCMPKEIFTKDYPYLPHSSVLTFEEITRIARQFAALGVRKIRLTGGEPLLRKEIEVLVAQLATLRTPDGRPLDLTLTTNGTLLARKARALKAAGLKRVTVSLDSLDDTIFRAMNDVDFPVRDVLDGIDTALQEGLGPIKVNMVVKRGVNDGEVLAMARHFRGTGIALRFIEYMDVGSSNGWRMNDVVPSAELLARLRAELPLVELPPTADGETAERWGYISSHNDSSNSAARHDPQAGELGFISSVTKAFCADCNRARLSTEGQLFLCLFASQGYDLRQVVRRGEAEGDADAELNRTIAAIWGGRADRYSAIRAEQPASADASTDKRRIEMSYIGG